MVKISHKGDSMLFYQSLSDPVNLDGQSKSVVELPYSKYIGQEIFLNYMRFWGIEGF